MSIQSLFEPQSVALVGASSDPLKPSGMVLSFLERSDYPGEVYCVNPRRERVGRHRSFASVKDLPETPEAAVVAVPSAAAVTAVGDCAEAGVRAVVLLTGGFGEGGGSDEESLARARRLDEIVASTGIRVLGPNTVGAVNFERSLPLTFADWYGRDSGLRGSTAVVTASGSVGGLLFQELQAEGVGVNYWVGLGNERDLDAADFIEYFAATGTIRSVVCFIEGVQDGARFLSAVTRLEEAGKHLIVAKAGRSEAGRRSTKSHTGKVSSAAEVYRDVLRQLGAVEVLSIREAAYVARALESAPDGYPAEVGLISASGGICSLMTDQADASGLRVSRLPQRIRERLSEIVPPYGSHDNPVDTSADAIHKASIVTGVLDAVADDETARTWIVAGRPILDRYGNELAAWAGSVRHKVVACSGVTLPEESRRLLGKAGIAVLTDTDACMTAIGRIARSAERDRGFVPSSAPPRRTLSNRSGEPSDVHAALRAAGLPVARSVFAGSVEEARASMAAEAMDFPVVVKVAVADITHKTEVGGVVLDVGGDDELADAFERIAVSVGAATGLEELTFEVQEMAGRGTELLMSVTADPDFGPIAVLGMGGVDLEVNPDVVHCAVPASADWYRTMVRSLRGHALLDGYRGRAAVAAGDVARLLADLVGVYTANPWIGEIELNPVIASHADGSLTIVDAVVTLASEGETS